jgi:hypothetical protein
VPRGEARALEVVVQALGATEDGAGENEGSSQGKECLHGPQMMAPPLVSMQLEA